jgi:hypothetical protein
MRGKSVRRALVAAARDRPPDRAGVRRLRAESETMSRRLMDRRRRSGRRRAAAPGAVLGAAAILCGCAHSAPSTAAAAHPGSAASAVCAAGAREALTHALALAPSSVATAASRGSNGLPQCTFSARSGHGARVEVVVNVDDGPQPYFVLERTIVEAAQSFAAQRLSPAPESVLGLGLEAAWFPAQSHLEATDGYRLITTTVDWPGAAPKLEIATARAMTAPYLRSPNGKAAQALAKGYPSS